MREEMVRRTLQSYERVLRFRFPDLADNSPTFLRHPSFSTDEISLSILRELFDAAGRFDSDECRADLLRNASMRKKKKIDQGE